MEVGGVYFKGNPAPSYKGSFNPNVISSSHKSWMGLAPTITSWPRDAGMPAEPYILHTPKGDMAIMKTSGNLFATPIDDYRKHGYFSQVDDFNMASWIDAGTKYGPSKFDEIPIAEKFRDSSVLVSLGEKQAKFMHGDTYLRKYVHDIDIIGWPNNEVGKAFSRIENLRQTLMRYYRTDEAQDFVDFLRSEGFELDEISWLGVRPHSWQGIYGVGRRIEDGRVVFLANEDAYSKQAEAADFFGIKTGQYVRDTIHEEMAHMARRSYDKAKTLSERLDEEEATKEMVRNFYLIKAEENEGKPAARHYRKMAALMQYDIYTTRERYTKIYRPEIGSLESLIKSLESEARRIGADPAEYVSAYLARHPAYAREAKEYGEEKGNYRTATKDKKSGKAREKSDGKGKEKDGRTAAKAEQTEESAKDSEGGRDSAEGDSGGESQGSEGGK